MRDGYKRPVGQSYGSLVMSYHRFIGCLFIEENKFIICNVNYSKDTKPIPPFLATLTNIPPL